MHPCYTFGEELTYWTFTGFPKLRAWMAAQKIPGVIFIGIFGYMPDFRMDLVNVVGPPISFPKIENPTIGDIDEWHGKYVDGLRSTFERNKGKYAATGDKAVLEVM